MITRREFIKGAVGAATIVATGVVGVESRADVPEVVGMDLGSGDFSVWHRVEHDHAADAFRYVRIPVSEIYI